MGEEHFRGEKNLLTGGEEKDFRKLGGNKRKNLNLSLMIFFFLSRSSLLSFGQKH
jgi:hypothetical protein